MGHLHVQEFYRQKRVLSLHSTEDWVAPSVVLRYTAPLPFPIIPSAKNQIPVLMARTTLWITYEVKLATVMNTHFIEPMERILMDQNWPAFHLNYYNSPSFLVLIIASYKYYMLNYLYLRFSSAQCSNFLLPKKY